MGRASGWERAACRMGNSVNYDDRKLIVKTSTSMTKWNKCEKVFFSYKIDTEKTGKKFQAQCLYDNVRWPRPSDGWNGVRWRDKTKTKKNVENKNRSNWTWALTRAKCFAFK